MENRVFRSIADSDPAKVPQGRFDISPLLALEPRTFKQATHGSARWFCQGASRVFDLPELPACYVFYLRNEPVYVGSTENLKRRISTHSIPNIIFQEERVNNRYELVLKFKISERLGDWLMWEYRLIKKLKPRFNVRHLEGSRNG